MGYAIIFVTYLIVWLVSEVRTRSGDGRKPVTVSFSLTKKLGA